MNRSPRDREPDVKQALALLREHTRALAAPPRVEALVREAFRTRETQPRRRTRWAWPRAAAAALASVALLLFLARDERSAIAPPVVALRHAPPAPEVHLARRALPPPAPVKERAPRREVATGFFPVRHGVPLDESEFVEVVRVSLPRAAMARYGLPVTGDLAAPVEADIIVGRDRMAQAIRFVRQ